MNMRKIYILFLALFFVFPNVIFANEYTQAEMDARVKQYDPKTGLTYIAENQQILTDEHSNISLEAFMYNGIVYPAGTEMITINENGVTGNVREGEFVTHDSNYLVGTEDSTLRFSGKGEMVYATVDADGNISYKNPTVKVTTYLDTIYDRQATIDMFNNNDIILEAVKIITGDDKLTFENYDEVAAVFQMTPLGEHMVFSGFGRAELVQYLEVDWENGMYVVRDVVKGAGVTVVDGFGTDSEHIVEYYLENKLYSVYGDGLLEFEEWNPDANDPDGDNPDEDDPDEDDTSGGGGGSGATWTSYGAASMSASVYSTMYNVSEAIPTSENITGTVSAKDISWNYGINKEYKTTKTYFFEGSLFNDYLL